LQTKKIKNEIKDFVDADIWIFKKEIYNGRICKDMIQNMLTHCGIMFEKEHSHQCYVTPTYFEADDETRKSTLKATERTIKQVP
jgi:hypothetical protein